jgi:hypothetical protein
MRGLARQRFLLPVIIVSGMSLILPVLGQAADNEFPPESEVASEPNTEKISYAEIEKLRELLEKQELQLAAQQEEIDKQRALLQSVQVQLDQFTVDQNVIPQREDAEQLERSISVDQLIATQPESTRYSDDFAGSIPIPDTEAAIKIGGFAKMSMVGTFDPLGTDDRFITGLIPVGAPGSGVGANEVNVSARQSRLGIEMRDSTSYGPLRAFVEGDFAGSGNTYRLRHAYGQFRQILAGKTWSTMVDNRATPEEIDFEGINGRIQVRQPQVRYFPSFGRDLDLLIGLEDPAPDVTDGRGVSQYPDIVASVRRNWADRWHIKTSLLARQIEAEWNLDPSTSDSKIGWGASVSGRVGLEIWDERDNILFQFNYGDGIGRYVNDLQEVGGQDAVFNPQTGELETLGVFSGYVAYQHWWQERLRSTMTYSWVDVDNLDFQVDSDYANTDRAVINLLWSPVTRIDVGGELLWGRRENKDGARATARQIQFGAKYRF